jgi:uncharacterized protein GlcG (DUF336 family)
MLTLAEANQAIAAALARAQTLNMRIAVSVCDEGGRLVAFQRMDGAFSESIPLAIGRAIGAAASRKSSGDKDDVLDLQSVWRVAGIGLPTLPGGEVFRSLATPRGWGRLVSPGAQQMKKTSNAPKPGLKLFSDSI